MRRQLLKLYIFGSVSHCSEYTVIDISIYSISIFLPAYLVFHKLMGFEIPIMFKGLDFHCVVHTYFLALEVMS